MWPLSSIIAVVFFAFSAATLTNAQLIPPSIRAYIDQMASGIENVVAAHQKKFTDLFDANERQLARQIAVRIDRADWNPFGARAFIDQSGKRHIVLTIGFILGSDLMDRAVLEMIALDESGKELVSYMKHVGTTLRKSGEAAAIGRRASDLKLFCEFVDNTDQKCRELRLKPDYGVQYTAFKVASLAVILGHEYAHHFKGHLTPNPGKSVYDMETEADRYGVALAIKAGFNPMFTMGSFMFFASGQVDLPVAREQDRHPNPLCRAIVAFGAGMDEAEKDTRFLEYFRDRSKEEQFRVAKRQLKELKQRETACQ